MEENDSPLALMTGNIFSARVQLTTNSFRDSRITVLVQCLIEASGSFVSDFERIFSMSSMEKLNESEKISGKIYETIWNDFKLNLRHK